MSDVDMLYLTASREARIHSEAARVALAIGADVNAVHTAMIRLARAAALSLNDPDHLTMVSRGLQKTLEQGVSPPPRLRVDRGDDAIPSRP